MGPPDINADDVWLLLDTAGLASLADITVAVVDTGIDPTNPEFRDGEGTSRITGGYNAIIGEPSTFDDDYGHGTHVAGIIGSAHDGTGIKGLAPTVKFLSVKVLRAEGWGTNEEIADGICWAADNGADVINLSLGGWGRSQVIQDAVDYANEQGTIVVAAMGNDYRYGTTHFPAACEGVIAVGATIPGGAKADFSSEGPYISVAAPGVDIFSTIWTAGGSSFGVWSGTSMATPHVVGLVALLLSKSPRPSATLVRSILERTAANPATWNKTVGYGRINAQAAFADTGGDLYGGLTVNLSGSGSLSNVEVLIRTNVALPVTKAANRTNSDGVAHFPYLRAGSYRVDVTKGTLSGSGTVTVTAGRRQRRR